jgi:hypothetical protein
MAIATNHPISREQAKVMNRYDITKRLVDLLHRDEAVIGGIGYTNFDLWAASETPHGRRQQNFYMLGPWGWQCRSRWAWRLRSRRGKSLHWRATDLF